MVSSAPATCQRTARGLRDGEPEGKKVCVLRKERIVTLTREPVVERPEELREQEIEKKETKKEVHVETGQPEMENGEVFERFVGKFG